jgi:cysteine desulfurase/selenocysteine lyase
VSYALEQLSEIPDIRLFGPPADRRGGIVLFDLPPHHPHDVAQILDYEGVAIRGGHHCCQPLMAKLGVVATNRASFYLYTLREEIDQLRDGLLTVQEKLG